jgi:hypothetical protein
MGRIGERISWTARLKGCVDPARGDLPIRELGSANPARRRTCRGNRPEDGCKCRHLPHHDHLSRRLSWSSSPWSAVRICVHRIAEQGPHPIPSPLHLLHLLHLPAQSEQSRNLALPRPSQRCTRNAEGSLRPRGWRIPNLHSYWRLLIETRDTVFVQLFPTSCLMRRASSTPRSYSLLDES